MNDYKTGDKVIITEGGAVGLIGVIEGPCGVSLWEIRLTWPGDTHSDIYVYGNDEFKAVEK